MENKLSKKKPKRTTFGKIFAKAMILPVLFTLIIAVVLNIYIEIISCEQVHDQQESLNNSLIRTIQFGEDKSGKFGRKEQLVNFKMGFGTFYDVYLPVISFPVSSYSTLKNDKKGTAVSALIDRDGNIIASNSLRL